MRRTLTLVFLTAALLVAAPIVLAALSDERAQQIAPSATPAQRAQRAPAPASTTDDDASTDPAAGDLDGEWAATWQRLDPRSLDPVGDPIELGSPMHTAASPDGRLLASAGYPLTREQGASRGRMMLVDTAQGSIVAETPVESVGYLRHSLIGGRLLAVTDAGAVIWAVEPSGGSSTDRIWIWDPAAGGPQPGPGLPAGFAARDMAILGDRLALFGETAGESPCWSCPARVIVVDLRDGGPLIDVAIPEIQLGWINSDSGGEQIRPGLAWDVERELAYVVEGDTVAVVDLSTGEAETAITRAASLLDQVLDWAAPTALAKAGQWVTYNARLSPDGARLYVTGVRTEPIYNADGQTSGEQQTPLGLHVIDAASLRLVDELALPVSDVEVAPDGRVLLTGVSDANLLSVPAQMASGLYIVSGDLRVEHHLADGMLVWVHGFPETGQALISFAGSGGRLQVIDLGNGDLVTERQDHSLSLPEGYLAGGFVADRGHSRPAQGWTAETG